MRPVVSRLVVLPALLALSLSACENDQIGREREPPPPPPQPDAMVFPDAEVYPDAEVDAGIADVGVPDAGEDIPVAREPMYINTGEALYAYDPVTGEAEVRGNFQSNQGPVTGMVDIAIDLNGRMFGGTTEKQLWRIDPETARCTFLATYTDILHGLTFISDGRLVVAGHGVTIIDPQTGRALEELVPEGQYETSGDIIGLPDGRLYWSVRGGRGMPDDMVRIDPATHDTVMLGSTGVEAIYGLGYATGILYGFLRDGQLVRINQTTAQATSAGPLEGRWYGATTNPVLW